MRVALKEEEEVGRARAWGKGHPFHRDSLSAY